MADWLLLRMARDTAQAMAWVVVDEHGQLVSPPGGGDDEALLMAAHGRRVALVVPGTDVLQLRAALPQAGDAKLRQLVPFALEDQLGEEVEGLHFALGTRDAAGDTPVQVVSRALLEEWLSRARGVGLAPMAAFTDLALVPGLPDQLVVLIDEDYLLLRRDGADPLALPATDPALALEMAKPADAALQDTAVTVYATPAGWQAHGAKFEALRNQLASLKIQLSPAGMLPLLAGGLSAQLPVNLLQGTYRVRTPSSAGWRRWRLAAMLAGTLLVLHGGTRLWELRRLQDASRALDTATRQLAETILPGGAATGTDLRRQVEQRLQAAAGDGRGQGEWLHMLSALAAARDNVPDARIEGIAFKPGEAQLRITGPEAASLEQFSKALRASGYAAQVTSGTSQDQSFHGVIQLGGAGS